MKKIRQIVKSLLLIAVLGFVAFFAAFPSGKVIIKADTTPTLTVSAAKVEGDYYISDNSGNIYITLSLSAACEHDVVVYFHGADATAVSEAGDYYFTGSTATSSSSNADKAKVTHKKNALTIAAGSKSGAINYNVGTAPMAANNNGVIRNYFYLVIDEVVGATLSGETSYKCGINYKRCMNVFNYAGVGNVFYDYTYKSQISFNTGDVEDAYTKYGDLLSDFPMLGYYASSIYDNVVTSGLGSLYVKVNTNINCGFPNINDYKQTLYPGNYAFYTNRIIAFHADSFFVDRDVTLDTRNGRDEFDDYSEMYADEGYSYCYYGDNYAGLDRDADVWISTRLVDKTYPQIKGYYIDSSNIKTNQKVNLALKFTEPVQVTSSCAIMAEYTVGTVTKDIKFTYSEGTFTDTLVFTTSLASIEVDSDNKLITAFSFNQFENVDKVGDLGLNKSSKPNMFTTNDRYTILTGSKRLCEPKATCNIDLRSPVLEIPKANTEAIVSSRKITLTVSKMASGNVYYAWRKEKDLVLTQASEYDYNLTITEDGSSSRNFIINGTGMTGEYYLYVMAVSDFGKVTTAKYGRTNSSGESKGGFLFDSTEPTINKGIILDDSLQAKVFEITTTDGTEIYDSQISSIYMYVAKDRNLLTATDPICIYGDKINKLGLSKYGYELNANALYLKSIDDGANVLGTSLIDYVFSSKNAAIDYLTLCELYDMSIETKYANETFTISSGEDQTFPEGKTNAYYIRYKSPTIDLSKYSAGTTASKNEYVYYLYETDDPSVIDYNKLSKNLKDTILDIATRIAENGSDIDLYKKGYVTEDCKSIVTTKHSFVNKILLSSISYLNSSFVSEDKTYSDKGLKITSVGGTFLYRLTAEDLGLTDGKYAYYTIWFVSVDKVGNTSVIPSSKNYVKYDTRTLFESYMNVTLNGEDTESIDIYQKAYDIGENPTDSLTDGLVMTFTTELTETDNGDILINGVYYQGSETPIAKTDYTNYFTYSAATKIGATKNSKISVKFKVPGYYKINFSLTEESEKVSEDYEFYITSELKEETNNYLTTQGQALLTNQVFQLGSEFYYLDSTNKVQNISYNYVYKEKDSTVKLSSYPATFSSKSEAIDYVQYYEYQDLSLLVLNSQTADALNDGANKEFVKADGERTAISGQVWIRYKRKTWSVNSTEYDWVYYYYGESGSTTISVSNLSDKLKESIDTIVTYIISMGKETALVGSDNIDENGAPKLHYTQKHYEAEVKTKSFTGSTFKPEIEYDGDKNIYQSFVSINEGGLTSLIPLVSNTSLVKADLNHLYYAYYNGTQEITKYDFVEVNYETGSIYRDVINGGSGIYFIREYGKEGINQYKIYIDNTAPTLQVSYKGAKDNVAHTPIFDSSVKGQTYSAKSFSIGAIDGSTEKDELSYVLVYNRNTMKLLNTYFFDFLQTNYATLETGEYYIVVSDRSGNSYNFNVNVNDQKLEVNVSIVDNDYVSVTINRTASQIYLYEVYLNNNPTPIDKTWDGSKKKYKESGYYRIVVRDIYDFTEEIGGETSYSFERDLPKITWSYLAEDGNYYRYEDGVTTCMKITQSLGSNIYINTSRPLRFTMSGEYAYTFTGIDSKEVSSSFLNNVVSINTTKDWEMEIYYVDYPDIKARYICKMDTSAPDINLTYKETSWKLDEYNYTLNPASTDYAGKVYTPSTIGYEANGESTSLITDSDVVASNLIKLQLYDTSGVSNLQIYLDDVLLSEYKEGVTSDQVITLSRFGKYKITATDVFGNKRTVTFTNKYTSEASYMVDGNIIDGRIDDETILYGHDSSEIKFAKDEGILTTKVTYEGKDPVVYLFNIENEKVTLANYVCQVALYNGVIYRQYELQNVTYKGTDSVGNVIDIDKVLFDISDVEFKVDKWYKILSLETDGIDLYAKYDVNKKFSFKVECVDSDVNVEYRATFEESVEPFYYNVKLSKKTSDVTLLDIDNNPILVNKEGLTYTNNTFTIDKLLDKEITSVSISYSDRKEFSEVETIYPYVIVKDNKEETTIKDFDTSRNGFYKIIIDNIYGNKETYIINRSDVFVVLAESTFKDGTLLRFSEKYEDTIKSNSSVRIEAYSNTVSFIIYKNDAIYEASIVNEEGYYYIDFIEEGNYVIKCTDEDYGNVVSKQISIVNSHLDYHEDLLIGYNESALRKDEGYTNQTLSLVIDNLTKYDIKYVTVKFEDKETVLYDMLAQETVDNLSSELTSKIGLFGSGSYLLTFKDSYGSVTTKEIFYKKEPTLVVSRTTKSSIDSKEYDINDVVANGIYSNGSIDISTTASYYKLKVDDNSEATLPYQLSLTFQTGSATIAHKIEYIDEYGFSYTFDAVLDRKELSLTIDPSVNVVSAKDVLTTKDDIIVVFNEGTCTYTLDGSSPITYISNSPLAKDGYYRFTVTDIAGNITTLAIKKDTYVDASFTDYSTGKTIINKSVVNKGPVDFSSNNGDNVTIKTVYLDGVKLDTNESRFSKQGQYKVLLQDSIGNESVFEFYLIKYEISEFHYRTPNSYQITDVWYSTGDGNFVSYRETITNVGTEYSLLDLTINGMYQVIMTSETYSSGISFSIVIDNSAPEISLVGCAEGEKTIEDVTINGFKEGDTIYVYKDGILISTTEVTGTLTDSPIIDEGGKYEVVVKNRAGVSTTLTFERKKIANNSGSALIIIACLAVAVGLIIGVVLRNKQKFDE